jgi:hypothetical protein
MRANCFSPDRPDPVAVAFRKADSEAIIDEHDRHEEMNAKADFHAALDRERGR